MDIWIFSSISLLVYKTFLERLSIELIQKIGLLKSALHKSRDLSQCQSLLAFSMIEAVKRHKWSREIWDIEDSSLGPSFLHWTHDIWPRKTVGVSLYGHGLSCVQGCLDNSLSSYRWLAYITFAIKLCLMNS